MQASVAAHQSGPMALFWTRGTLAASSGPVFCSADGGAAGGARDRQGQSRESEGFELPLRYWLSSW